MPRLEFIIATQDDKGRPTRRKGWLQKVNTHSAILGGAARKRKALQDRAYLMNESRRRQSVASQSDETSSDPALSEEQTAPISNFDDVFSVDLIPEANLFGQLPTETISEENYEQQGAIFMNDESKRDEYWFSRCADHQVTEVPVNCDKCGLFDIHFPAEARDYRQGLRVQRWLSNRIKIPNKKPHSVNSLVQVPVALTPRESALLQFWSQDDWITPSHASTNSPDDSGLNGASPPIDMSPVFALTHIAMSEHGLFRLTGQLRPSFYRHRAEAYRAANDILSNPKACVEAKFSALQNLHIMDVTLGRLDLLTLHAQARDYLLTLHGGLIKMLSDQCGTGSRVDPTNILLMFLWSASVNKFSDQEALRAASQDFIESLSKISKYASLLSLHQSHDGMQRRSHAAKLEPLFRYLQSMIDNHLRQRPDNQYAETTGACTFALLFDLGLAITEIDGTILTVVGRFERLQQYMMASLTESMPGQADDASEENQLTQLAPYAALATVGHVRRYAIAAGFSSLNSEQELRIYASSINAVRVFSLLSRSTRLHIARSLLKCLLGFTKEASVNPFDDESIGDIQIELNANWTAQQEERGQ